MAAHLETTFRDHTHSTSTLCAYLKLQRAQQRHSEGTQKQSEAIRGQSVVNQWQSMTNSAIELAHDDAAASFLEMVRELGGTASRRARSSAKWMRATGVERAAFTL